MKAVLKRCSYNKAHNFNLLSMSRLLHSECWKITHGDQLLICIECSRKDGVINFDIVVPTLNGAVYTCKFAQWK